MRYTGPMPGASGGGGGITIHAYATRAALYAAHAASPLANGSYWTIPGGGRNGGDLVGTVESGTITPDPLSMGMGALYLGSGAYGYQDALGASSEDASGIVLRANTGAAAWSDTSYPGGAPGYWGYGEKIYLGLPAVSSGRSLLIRATIRVEAVSKTASNDLEVMLGLANPADPDDAIGVRCYWYTDWQLLGSSWNDGTQTGHVAQALLNDADGFTTAQDVGFELYCSNYGAAAVWMCDVDDGTAMARGTGTPTGGWPSFMAAASPSPVVYVAAACKDNGTPGDVIATLKSLEVSAL